MAGTELEALREECTLCKKCPLCQDRLNIVFGKGSENADIIFVGNAPSDKDELTGDCFTGENGRILSAFLSLCNIDEGRDAYITNLIKCQPSSQKLLTDQCYEKCMEHFRSQVRIIRPKIIVCLGEAVAKRLIDADFSIRENHGRFIKKGKLTFFTLYHPSEMTSGSVKREEGLKAFQLLRQSLEKAGILSPLQK